MADASSHTSGLHRQAASVLVPPFDTRETSDTLLARACCATVQALLVGTSLQAFAISPATLLVDQHDAILGPLVDRVPRACGKAGRVRTVIANSRKIEEPGLVLGQCLPAFEILALGAFLRTHRMVFVAVGCGPLLIRGQVSEGLLRPLG